MKPAARNQLYTPNLKEKQ